MPQIEISEETLTKLASMEKIIDNILEKKPEDELNYAELVLITGIEDTILRCFPADNKLLQDSMVQMFDKNPEFVTTFIVDTLERGQEVQRLRDRWQRSGRNDEG